MFSKVGEKCEVHALDAILFICLSETPTFTVGFPARCWVEFSVFVRVVRNVTRSYELESDTLLSSGPG